MKSAWLYAPLLGLALASTAPALELSKVDPARSSITFVVHEMGVAVDGSFRRFSAQFRFDPAKPAAGEASIDLDVASIDAGSAEANDEVAGKAWFDTRAFPQARFVATGFRALGGNRYEANGRISIKGRTQEVSAPFTLTQQGRDTAFDGSFILKRADFAIGEGEWADFGTVANEVQIRFHFLAAAGK